MAVVKQITQYETKDGKVFLTLEEAELYEFQLDNQAEIDAAVEAYLNTVKLADRARSIQGNASRNFLAFYIKWIQDGKPAVERTVFDTPKVDKAEADAAGAVADEAVADEAEMQF